MGTDIIVHLTQSLLWLVLMLSLPVVVVASVVGIIVSLVQALTQIQEQTIQFLVKLVAVSIVLVATYRWTGDTLLSYATLSFNQISAMR